MSFSNGGGTLALPSPTHVHQMDVTAAVRNLRRSMSRSPTKFLTRSDSQKPNSLRQTSPHRSSCRRVSATPPQQHRQLPTNTPRPAPPPPVSAHSDSGLIAGRAPHQSAALTPLRPSAKLSLRAVKAAKTLTPARITRARASPKSPLKRALDSTSDSGNSGALPSTSVSPKKRLMGQENTNSLRSSPRKCTEKSRQSSQVDSGATQIAFLKSLDTINDPSIVSTAGALKRSDATMNLDQPNQGSPVAKRRSTQNMAGEGQVENMNIFGAHTTSSQSFDVLEDSFPEYELSPLQQVIVVSTPTTAIPKRSSSLRRSTLQQRYGDKTSWGRRSGERQLAQLGGEFSTPVRSRPSLSTDQFVPPQSAREGPFAPASPLPNSSLMTTDRKTQSTQPHPLSKTLTPSLSGNSLTEEPSQHVSAKVIDKQKAHPFSKSLPPGASRPTARPNDHAKVMATPLHSHSSQLWGGAFTSTGLISKVNRNPEDEANKKMAPPDTPCKKQTNPFATFPPSAGSAMKKRPQNRNSIVGLTSSPFNLSLTRTPETFGTNPAKGMSIFQRASASKGMRRASLLSLDAEDRRLFSGPGEIQHFLEEDAPPTPTRLSLTPGLDNLSESSLESPSANRSMAFPSSALKPAMTRDVSCKSTMESPSSSNEQVDEACGGHANQPSPLSSGPSPEQRVSPISPRRSKSRRGYSTPPPFITETPCTAKHGVLSFKSAKKAFAKISCIDLASPANGGQTPQTPQESLLPLDTSRLSISRGGDGFGESGRPPPVTPTTARDFRSSASIFVTPVNARTSSVDIDASLYSRFDKVEQIGKGEFSTVYRVTKIDHKAASFSVSTVTPLDYGRSPGKGRMFAVKKSKQPYSGQKDRQAKLKEARILKALAHSDHVVQYVDEWEHNSHLYIQTEFCEEGTLDKFLSNVGRSGRLDDFRIYKIFQDLCLGLKEIHDAGFMHLDMKPANIFITFEGALKIGDFGLAESSSTVKKVDIEGDREYMAPEMLNGRASQAADVFSLGLMTLETAANVVLPENGPTWVALRSGDLSEVPSLTWNPSVEVQRDISGNPTDVAHSSDDAPESKPRGSGNLFGSFKRPELQQPPDFMVQAIHPSSLDSVVRWMTQEHAENRPSIEQVLALEGLQWVAEHRNAPATVYEGNWGPIDLFPVSVSHNDDDDDANDADDDADDDTQMMDA